MFIQFDWTSLVLDFPSEMRAITKKKTPKIAYHETLRKRMKEKFLQRTQYHSQFTSYPLNVERTHPSPLPNMANRVFEGDQWLSTITNLRASDKSFCYNFCQISIIDSNFDDLILIVYRSHYEYCRCQSHKLSSFRPSPFEFQISAVIIASRRFRYHQSAWGGIHFA